MRDAEEVTLFLDLGSSENAWSPHTRDAYRRDLHLYCSFLTSLEKKGLSESTADLIVEFLARRRRAGDADRTLNRRLAALRSFHRHLLREGIVDEDVFARLPRARRPSSLPRHLSRAETASLLEVARGGDPLALRDRCLVEMLYATGVRVSELVGLRESDVTPGPDRRTRTVKVLGKGGKERYVPVHAAAVRALDAYLARGRPRLLAPDHAAALFLTRTGRPMNRQAVYERLRRLGLRAGIRRPVTPHLLRHTFATHLVEEGGDLRAVQELLGHAHPETTTLYTSVDAKRLKAIHEKHHPRS